MTYGWSKLKRIADNILKCILNEKEVPYGVENIVRKREIACFRQILLFSQCFPKLYIFSNGLSYLTKRLLWDACIGREKVQA